MMIFFFLLLISASFTALVPFYVVTSSTDTSLDPAITFANLSSALQKASESSSSISSDFHIYMANGTTTLGNTTDLASIETLSAYSITIEPLPCSAEGSALAAFAKFCATSPPVLAMDSTSAANLNFYSNPKVLIRNISFMSKNVSSKAFPVIAFTYKDTKTSNDIEGITFNSCQFHQVRIQISKDDSKSIAYYFVRFYDSDFNFYTNWTTSVITVTNVSAQLNVSLVDIRTTAMTPNNTINMSVFFRAKNIDYVVFEQVRMAEMMNLQWEVLLYLQTVLDGKVYNMELTGYYGREMLFMSFGTYATITMTNATIDRMTCDTMFYLSPTPVLRMSNVTISNSVSLSPLISLTSFWSFMFNYTQFINNKVSQILNAAAFQAKSQILNSMFLNNEAKSGLVTIMNTGNLNVTIANSKFSGTLSSGDDASDVNIVSGIVNIAYVIFMNTRQKNLKGYLRVTNNATLYIENTYFYNGRGEDSASIFTSDGCVVTLKRVRFFDSIEGKSEYISNSDKSVSISGCIFSRLAGAGVTINYLRSDTVVMYGNEFNNLGDAALVLKNVGRVQIIQCTFLGARGLNRTVGSTRAIEGSVKNLQVQDSLMNGMYALEQGGAINVEIDFSITKFSPAFRIIDSTIMNCISQDSGGALYVKAQPDLSEPSGTTFDGVLESAIFLNNSASTSGGALFYICDQDQVICSMRINNCRFENNSASVKGGGAIRSSMGDPTITDCLFLNNSAHFGSDVVGAASKVILTTSYQPIAYIDKNGISVNESLNYTEVIENDQNLTNTTSENCTSTLQSPNCSISTKTSMLYPIGDKYISNTTLTIMDSQGNIIEDDITSYARISYNDTVSSGFMIYPTILTAVKGVISLQNLIASAPRSTSKVLNLTLALINPFTMATISNSDNLISFQILLYFPACLQGEELTSDQKCSKCPIDKYSFVPGSSCRDCEPHMKCFGGSAIAPEVGYWRASNSTLYAFMCPYKDACLAGDKDHPQGICNEKAGFTGIGCMECISGHTLSSGRCIKCPVSGLNLFFIFIIFVGIVSLNIFLIHVSISHRNPHLWDTRKSSSYFYMAYFKILLTHIIQMSIISQFNIDWPEYISTFFSVINLGLGSSQATLSLGCIFDSLVDNPNSIYYKLLIFLSLPVVILILIVIVWAIIAWYSKTSLSVKKCSISYLIIFSWVYVSINQMGAYALGYFELDHNDYRMVLDARKRRDDQRYGYFGFLQGGAILALWGIGSLVVELYILCKNKQKKTTADDKIEKKDRKFSFLTSGFRDERYWWDICIQARKLALAVIAGVFAGSSESVQLGWGSAIFILYICCYQIFSPHIDENKRKWLSYLELASNIIILFSMFMYLFLSSFDNPSNSWKFSALGVYLFLNSLFVGKCIIQIRIELGLMLSDEKNKLGVKTKILRIICCCPESEDHGKTKKHALSHDGIIETANLSFKPDLKQDGSANTEQYGSGISLNDITIGNAMDGTRPVTRIGHYPTSPGATERGLLSKNSSVDLNGQIE